VSKNVAWRCVLRAQKLENAFSAAPAPTVELTVHPGTLAGCFRGVKEREGRGKGGP